MSTPSDKSTRKSASRTRSQEAGPSTQRTPGVDDSGSDAPLPDVVRADLAREDVSSDSDRTRWISERAYEIAQTRGFAPGAELDDWLQAEREYDASNPEQVRPEDQFTG